MSFDVDARLRDVRERIAAACRRSERPTDAVTLVAVSKGHPAQAVIEAHAAGQRVFAENYAQELADKAAATAGLGVEWHFVGGLQRNKIKKVTGLAALVHSLDSLTLATEIDRRAGALGKVQDVLVQVNLDAEGQKSGVTPDALSQLLDGLGACRWLRCRGLMAIPRPTPQEEQARAAFRALARLARARGLADLSMGMSSDFEVAIEEGATMVRVGTALFGPRPTGYSTPRL